MQERHQVPPMRQCVIFLDLWQMLVKHKKLVLLMPVIFVLLAALYLLVTPSVFESRTVVQVGQIGRVGALEAPPVLVHRLREQYQVDDIGAEKEMPKISEISADKKNVNAVTIIAQDNSPEGARRYLDQTVRELLSSHAKLYSQVIDEQNQHLQSLNGQINAMNAHITKLSAYTEELRTKSPVQVALLAIERGKLLAEVASLENEYMALRLALSGMQTQPTRLLKEPTLPEIRAKPNRQLVLVLAVILGLMLGVFAAFVVELLARAKLHLAQITPKEA